MWPRRKSEKDTTEQATEALQDAQQNLQRVKRRGSEVKRVSTAIRNLRERNHFVEQIEEIIVRRGFME